MDLSSYLPPNQYRHYFASLDPQAQTAYDTLLEGYLKHAEEIQILLKNPQDLWDIHRAILYDVTEIFYIKSITATSNPTNGIVTVYPVYRFDPQTHADILEQMKERTKTILSGIKTLPEEERIRKLHDYLIQNVTYKDVSAPYSHEAPGTILYGIGVCEGISKAFKYLADRAGIRSIVVVGYADGAGGNACHAWNIVYADAQPYQLDVTFDKGMSKENLIRYDYYLLSDAQIKEDHSWEDQPACDVSAQYYRRIGCFADSKKTLAKMVSGKLRPDTPLVFEMPELSEDKEKIQETVINVVTASVPMRYALGRSISWSCNRKRMIFQVQMQ